MPKFSYAASKLLAVPLAAVMLLGAAALPAHAGGFLGDIINQAAPGLGTQLDQMNHDLGHPTEIIIERGADMIVPGSGEAMALYRAAQEAGIFDGTFTDFSSLSPQDLADIADLLNE